MSKRDKLVSLMVSRPSEATFADVKAILEMFGWELARTKGSHHSFKKPGEGTIIVPVTGGTKVKRHYLDQICSQLGLDELVK